MARLSDIVRAGAIALFLLGLSGCSYDVRLQAAFINGHFGFVLAEGAHPERSRCLNELILSNDAGETIWEIQRPQSEFGECDSWLPLAYGSAPPGLRTLVAAHRLETERVYSLRGHAFNSIESAFVLHRAGASLSVENLDPHGHRAGAVAGAANYWQAEQDRRAFENAQRPEHQDGVPFADRPLPPEQR
jgi:hypothetical protein